MPFTVHTNIHDEFVYMSITFMQSIYLENIFQIQKCLNLWRYENNFIHVNQYGGPGA